NKTPTPKRCSACELRCAGADHTATGTRSRPLRRTHWSDCVMALCAAHNEVCQINQPLLTRRRDRALCGGGRSPRDGWIGRERRASTAGLRVVVDFLTSSAMASAEM